MTDSPPLDATDSVMAFMERCTDDILRLRSEVRQLHRALGYVDAATEEADSLIRKAIGSPSQGEASLQAALRRLEACRAEIAKTDPRTAT